MILQVVDEADRLHVFIDQKLKGLSEQRSVLHEERVQALGAGEEVIGEVGAIGGERLQLLKRDVELVKAVTAQLADQRGERIGSLHGQRVFEVVGQRLAWLRFDAKERDG